MEDEISFLLEQEKKSLELEIAERHNPESSVSKVENEVVEKPIEKPVKRSKDDIVNDFMKLQESTGNVVYKQSALKRKTRQELLKMMAEFSSDVLMNASPSKPDVSESNPNPDPPVEKEVLQNGNVQLDPNQMNMISEALFNMNLALVGSLETGSIFLKDKTGDIALLENWSKKIVDKKTQFLEVFKQIYAQNRCELDKYMSPVVLYGVLMTQSAAEAVYQNVHEKKK